MKQTNSEINIPEFKMQKMHPCDKDIIIYGTNLAIKVNYDDVLHRLVRKDVKKMLKILNKYWDEEEQQCSENG
jgi:hypothetical protein